MAEADLSNGSRTELFGKLCWQNGHGISLLQYTYVSILTQLHDRLLHRNLIKCDVTVNIHKVQSMKHTSYFYFRFLLYFPMLSRTLYGCTPYSENVIFI